MKKIISLALAAALTASLAGCASSDAASTASSTAPATSTAESTADGSASSGDTIKIGVLTDRSSAAAATVTWAEAGAILALEEENEAGGLNGKQFELVYRDTASDSANVAQKATELVNEGCIAILGPKSDGEAPTGATWAEENKFPMVTPCTMNTRVTIENASKYMFSCGFVAWPIAKMNAKYAADQGYNSAFFIGNDGGASGDSRDFFYYELGDGFQNLGSNQVSSNSTEFSTIISSVVGKDPDVIIGAVAGPNFVSLVNQGQQFGCGISATTSAGTPATPPTPSLWLKLATILMVRFTALTCGLSGWMRSTAMLSSSSATPRSAKSTSTKTFCPLTWATPGTLASRQSAKLPRQLLMT